MSTTMVCLGISSFTFGTYMYMTISNSISTYHGSSQGNPLREVKAGMPGSMYDRSQNISINIQMTLIIRSPTSHGLWKLQVLHYTKKSKFPFDM